MATASQYCDRRVTWGAAYGAVEAAGDPPARRPFEVR